MNYEQLCSFEVLYAAYKTARQGKREKQGAAQYEANALACTARLSRLLLSGAYKPGKFEVFTVYEPKKRLVQAPAFVDKVVQHAIVDNILYEAITSSFIQDSYASQVWKGMHVGLNRLKEQMQDYFQKRKGHDETARRAAGLPPRPPEQWDYADGWILKADVHHFFASIDHNILKEKLRRKVADDRIFALMCTYIDSTDGLPLGYQTSQLLALMYLDEFDHFEERDQLPGLPHIFGQRRRGGHEATPGQHTADERPDQGLERRLSGGENQPGKDRGMLESVGRTRGPRGHLRIAAEDGGGSIRHNRRAADRPQEDPQVKI